MPKEIKLGTKVEDKITGFIGIAEQRLEYMNGCVQYGVRPRVNEKMVMPELCYIDWQSLKVHEKKKTRKKPVLAITGGGPTIIGKLGSR